MKIRAIGVDLGKTSFHLVALGERGKTVIKKKLSRKQLLTFTANLQPSLIGLEACSGSHFLGRALSQQGHDVRLIPAQFVKPFVKSNKNDYLDAEALAEAVERENMRFVPIKTDDQLDLQALHRVRDRLVSRRTAVINQVRALLASLWQEWKHLEEQVEVLSGEIGSICDSDPACQRLRQIPGVGPLVATAVVAAIGNGAAFHKGREFSAWLGLVPRQYSTGGKPKLLGISKRGNPYLRKMFIHGARAAVLRLKRERSLIGRWMDGLEARAPRNVLIVAMANKLARIAWAVLVSGEPYRAATATT